MHARTCPPLRRTAAPLERRTDDHPNEHPEPARQPADPVQAKLAAAWTSLMFFVIYIDYFHLYKPGAIDQIRGGVIFGFDITPMCASPGDICLSSSSHFPPTENS